MNAIDFFKEEDPGNNYEYSSNSNDANWLYDKNDMVMFAERYHQAKLKLLGIANDEDRSEQFCTCQLPSMNMRGGCFKCGLEVNIYTKPKLHQTTIK